MTPYVLEVKNLVKRYKSFDAVKGISFHIRRGEVVGFLGPNGAGKTTTIQMLMGITLSNSGTIRYFGKDFFHHRQECLKKINFASAFNTLMARISVKENLMVFAYLYEIENPKRKIEELSEYFDARDLLSQRYQDLSSGQKTRINLIKALLNDPELLLLDEPTASLDPDIADKTMSLIEDMKQQRNLSILYTSHNMEEITRICDDVIFLDHGEIVAHDTPLNLTKMVKQATIRLMFDGKKEEVQSYLEEKDILPSFPHANTVIIQTKEQDIPSIIFGISKLGIWITDIEIKKPTLEDVFLHIART